MPDENECAKTKPPEVELADAIFKRCVLDECDGLWFDRAKATAMIAKYGEAQSARIADLEREVEEANAACAYVIDSLTWTGDGYEWDPGHGDYRETPAAGLTRGRDAYRADLAAEKQRSEAAEKERDEAKADQQRYEKAHYATQDAIEQTAAKALGFSRYIDLPDMWPDATEENGYYVGEYDAISLVEEMTKRLAAARELREEDTAWMSRKLRKCEKANAKIHAMKAVIAKFRSADEESFSGRDVADEIRSCLRYPDSWAKRIPQEAGAAGEP